MPPAVDRAGSRGAARTCGQRSSGPTTTSRCTACALHVYRMCTACALHAKGVQRARAVHAHAQALGPTRVYVCAEAVTDDHSEHVQMYAWCVHSMCMTMPSSCAAARVWSRQPPAPRRTAYAATRASTSSLRRAAGAASSAASGGEAGGEASPAWDPARDARVCRLPQYSAT